MLKRLNIILILLFIFGFGGTLLGDESANKYFPSTLGSYWVYEDQDGNELTRRAVEGEEIAGKTFPAFSYEPELEDWADYSYFIHPSLYQAGETGIKLVVSDEVEKAVKARLSKEMETFIEIMGNDDPTANISYTIDVEAEDHFYLLPTSITPDEEWDVNQIKTNLKLIDEDTEEFSIDFTIIETGIVLGTETIETAAGTFEDCLKVKYHTETTAVFTPPVPPEEVDSPGETVTTVWFAPNVGIVKFHQKTEHTFLELIPDDEGLPLPPAPVPKTLELKKYKIKSDKSEVE